MAFLIMLTMLPILEPKSGTPMDVKKRTPLKLQFEKRNVKDSLWQQVRHWAAKMILGNRLTRRRPVMTKIKILQVKEPAKVTMHHP